MPTLPIPFNDRDGFIWFDGETVPWRGEHINIMTHGLHYASSVFEGLRVYDGKIFKLEEHTDRLFYSAETLDMEIPFTKEELNQAHLDIVAKQNVQNGYIRPIVWRGSEMMAISAQYTKIHVAIATWETKTYYPPELLENGIKMTIAPWRRPDPATIPCHTKAAGLYMICTLSKHAAEKDGYHDAIMYDWRGQLAEATGANLFLVIDGALHTPTPDCFLDGITRRTIIGLAKEQGLEVVERAMFPEDLGRATEAFLTGTAAEVTPVGSIAEHQYKVTDITKNLRQAYQALVRK